MNLSLLTNQLQRSDEADRALRCGRRTAGRTLLDKPPFDTGLTNDIRFFFAGDFKLRATSAASQRRVRVWTRSRPDRRTHWRA